MAIVWRAPRRVFLDPLNLLLTTLAGAAAAAPFVPVDLQVVVRRTAPELVDPPNLLTAELSQPFAQNDWPTPKWGGYVRAIDPPNLQASLTQPFALTDWPELRWRGYGRPIDPPNLLHAELSFPFTQTDWPTTRWGGFGRVIDLPNLLNENLSQPFRQVDWPVPRHPAQVRASDPPSPVLVLSPAVGGRFYTSVFRSRVYQSLGLPGAG